MSLEKYANNNFSIKKFRKELEIFVNFILGEILGHSESIARKRHINFLRIKINFLLNTLNQLSET